MPSPSPGALSALVSVSADSPSDAWAVGTQRAAVTSGGLLSLAEHWDGHTWSVVPTQDAPEGDTNLVGVLALRPGDVYAVGNATLQHWDGTGWTSQTVSTDPSYSNTYFGLGGSRPRSGLARPGSGSLWLAGYQDTDSALAGGQVLENLVARGCGG